jgi:hypothetical protein
MVSNDRNDVAKNTTGAIHPILLVTNVAPGCYRRRCFNFLWRFYRSSNLLSFLLKAWHRFTLILLNQPAWGHIYEREK